MKFFKKRYSITAEQYVPNMAELPCGVREEWEWPDHTGHCRALLKTPWGLLTINPGDWVVTDIDGESYPCEPKVFATTYEPVVE
jgi:hypothetical protein